LEHASAYYFDVNTTKTKLRNNPEVSEYSEAKFTYEVFIANLMTGTIPRLSTVYHRTPEITKHNPL